MSATTRALRPARALRTLGMVGALALTLPACGGGGSEGAGPGNESQFFNVAFDAGTTTNAFNSTEQLSKLGDNASDQGRRLLLRFNMPVLPAGATVVGAFLHLRTGIRIELDSNDLGRMRFVRADFGVGVSSGDYSSAELEHHPDGDFVVSPENFDMRIDVLNLYESAIAASDETLDIRMLYENETDSDSTEDSLEFVMSNHPTLDGPRLEMVFELP